MKIRLLLPIILISLIGCNSKEDAKIKPVPKQISNNDFHFDGFPVYNISKEIDAITFELNEYDEKDHFYKIYNKVEKEDTLFAFESRLRPINSILIDSSGTFNIFRSKKLEERIKAKLKSSYYVYGTKGFTRVTLGEVYFTIHECYSNIVAVKIIGYDKNKYGRPLICSEKPIVDLVYGTNYSKAEKAIERAEKANEGGADYMNPPGTGTVFANIGSNYFAYEDDFSRKRDDPDGLSFPGRTIYNINNKGKANRIWGYCLDLFGIPCD
ncbi:hypothetical protein [Flavobacterium wongokense]|uniref:hypothetical protein n=1 Tax=Flavobacterium wongokense TaxID=2910674 RepID=UPI001F256576|nr:hypothetical protein [Flavobacterium sp. WG47]MCF6133195.1 hypothetical protein [Flavobacterium sp. WG47]